LVDLKAPGATSVALSPDGKRLAIAGRDLAVWNVATLERVLTVPKLQDRLTGVVFSPDGQRLAACGRGGLVRIWDAAKGQLMLTLDAHGGDLTGVVFSPDGKRLAAGSRWGGDGQPLLPSAVK